MSKRVLALALALLMVVGLLTVASAGNLNDMPDRADVSEEFVVAVGVLVNLGIIEGNENNEVAPDLTVTRAEMAALIYRMVTGSRDAPAATTTFTDVPAGFWGRNVIGWAQGQGIIFGFGDGTFGPNQPVTVVQAATMILRALGYGTQGEFTYNPNWEANANNFAIQTDIYNSDILAAVSTTDGAPREVIAQMIFNALIVDRVTWDNRLNQYVSINAGYGAAPFVYYGERWEMDPTDTITTPRNIDDNDDLIDVALANIRPEVAAPAILEFYLLNAFDDTGATGGLDTDFPWNDPLMADAPSADWNTYVPVENEMGRVVNIHTNDAGRVFYLHIRSTDVNVAAGSTDAQVVAALGLNRQNGVFRAMGMSVLENFVWDSGVAPTADVTFTAAGAPDVTAPALLEASAVNATYVLFTDANGDTWFPTVVYGTQTLVDVTAAAGANVILGSTILGVTPAIPLANIVNNLGINLNVTTLTNVWAMAEVMVVDGEVRTVLNPVETVTGRVTGVLGRNFTIAGENFNYRSFNDAGGAASRDLGMNSLQLEARDLAENFVTFLNNWNPANPNLEIWTVFINALTGNVVAAQQMRPDPANRQFAIVTSTGWQGNDVTGEPRAEFVTADGVVRSNVFARPVTITGATADAIRTNMGTMRGQAVWATEVEGVWFLEQVNFATMNASTFPTYYSVAGATNVGTSTAAPWANAIAVSNVQLDFGQQTRFVVLAGTSVQNLTATVSMGNRDFGPATAFFVVDETATGGIAPITTVFVVPNGIAGVAAPIVTLP